MEPITTRRSTYTLLIILFLVLAIAATLFLVFKRQEIRFKAVGADTTLELVPNATTVNSGDQVVFDVNMNTNQNSIFTVNLVLQFDTNFFDGVKFEKTAALVKELLPGTFTGNQAKLTLGTDEVIGSVSGQMTIAKLTLNAKAATSGTDVVFLVATPTDVTALTEVTAFNDFLDPINALKSTIPVTMVINGGGLATPLPSPTPAISPTPLPSPTLPPVTTGDVRLIMAPSLQNVNSGDQFDASLNIYTGTSQVSTLDLKLTYNPNFLEVVTVTPSNFLPDVTVPVNINSTTGIITATFSSATPKQGDGIILLVKLKAKTNGVTNMIVDPTSLVTLAGSSDNLVKERGSLLVNIGQNQIVYPPPTPPGGTCNKAAPNRPSGLVGGLGADLTKVNLSWIGSSGASHYGIVFGKKPGEYIYGATNVGNYTRYTVSQLAPYTTYYFAVYAVNDCAASGNSNEVMVRTSAPGVGGPVVRPPTPRPTPRPTLTPTPINQNIYNPGDEGDNTYLISSPTPTPLPRFSPTPSPKVSTGLFGGTSFLISPLGGILLIIAAILIALLILRMRSD